MKVGLIFQVVLGLRFYNTFLYLIHLTLMVLLFNALGLKFNQEEFIFNSLTISSSLKINTLDSNQNTPMIIISINSLSLY